ncbi:MAG TPA: MarR family winged helix-turn-helix transcriptional regulator [Usitatibacter sp.]|nr:MarR family winged helix-turn-helix transcriptional regulator [Usitatibacter sp.]
MRRGIPATRADRIRRFDRFYERRIQAGHRAAKVLELTVAEMRVLEVLGEAGHSPTAVWLQWRTELDAGYLCRILAKFCAYGYTTAHPSANDRRSRQFALTDWGRGIVQELDRFHRERAEALLESLPQRERSRLLRAMALIEEVLARDAMENLLEASRAGRLRRAGRRIVRGTCSRDAGGSARD